MLRSSITLGLYLFDAKPIELQFRLAYTVVTTTELMGEQNGTPKKGSKSGPATGGGRD
jgi:hypothetical protein